MSVTSAAAEWLETLRPGGVGRLFDHLPHMLYFAKDRELRLMAGNPAFVARCGFNAEREMIGHTDHELFRADLAEKYRADDLQVITSQQPLTGIIELFPSRIGEPEWFITDKLPLFDRAGNIAGLCGTVRSYEGTRAGLQPYLDLVPVTDHLARNFSDNFAISDLAAMAGMSVRQLERRFRETFNTTPGQYIHKLRILEACELLIGSRMSVTEIALRLGYYDHSAFSRTFSKLMKMPPRDYRARFSSAESVKNDSRTTFRKSAPVRFHPPDTGGDSIRRFD